MLLLVLTAGLGAAQAANLLTNPGFEGGLTGWDSKVRGATFSLVTTAGAAHTGSNCVTVTGQANGWASIAQGDTQSAAYGTGVSIPVSGSNYYKLSAWVKVPGASTTPQGVTLRYRFEPSGNRVDVGTKTINTEDWTYLESGWVQPAAGDTFVSYFEVHSLNNGITMLVDDCALTESTPIEITGRVTNGGTGVDGANVSASNAGFASAITTTAGGGNYSGLMVPPGTYTVSANAPGLKGSVSVTATTSPTVAPDIALGTDPDYDPDLIFSLRSSAVGTSGSWPAAYPAGSPLARMGAPSVETIRGQQWEKNSYTSGDGWRFTAAAGASIPVNGATIVAVVKHRRTVDSWWSSIVNCFYNSLMLNVRNTDGRIQLVINDWPGNTDYDGPVLADGQEAVVTGVVNPDGTLKVYVNDGAANNLPKAASSFTEITVGGTGSFPYGQNVNVGRNDPDGWTTLNGSIGDVYFYKVVLDETKRVALVKALMEKFGITNKVYTIAGSVVGPGGTMDPVGPAIGVPQGLDKTFTITPWDAHWAVKSVLVDGVDVGPVTSYTFKSVNADGHTIVASFMALPTTIVSGRVTDGTKGIMGATVYFKTTANASVNPQFTTATTTYDGNYSVAMLPGSWFVAAGALYHNTSADVPLVLGSAPVTLDFTLTKQISTLQPLLVGKGTGATRTDAFTNGFKFTTGPSSIDVTQLGYVDVEGDGLLAEHAVAIWQDTNMITSAAVPAGTAGTKVGDFRYAPANPAVTLLPNTTYTLGGDTTGGDAWPDVANNPGFNAPDFSSLTGVGALTSAAPLAEPITAAGAAGQVYAVANLIGKMSAPPTLKVSGVVKDAFGVGINNAVVQIGGTTGPATVTDAHGKYEFFDVPFGAGQEVYADALGYADKLDTVDTTNAATTPVAKDLVLTAKLETGVIQNGGFENGLAPWVLNYGSQLVGTTTVDKYSGNYAGFWKSVVPVWYNGYLTYTMPIIAGSTYNIYFKLKTDTAVGQCGFDFLDANGNEAPWWGYAGGLSPGSNWMYTTVPGKWEQVLNYRSWDDSAHTVGVRMTPPDGTVSIRIVLGLGSDAVGQTLYVDDVVIDRVGPDATPGPFTAQDVVDCLRWSGGVAGLPAGFLARYDVVTDGKITAEDAMRIARKVNGLDTNP